MICSRNCLTNKNRNAWIEHTLENCPCGVPKHNPKTLKKWNKKHHRIVSTTSKSIKKAMLKRHERKTPVINVGGEYKK